MTSESLLTSETAHGTPTRNTTAWRVFVVLAVVLLPVMVTASFDFGVTWDEVSRHRYGQDIWEYLRGLRPRDSFIEDGGHLYGGLFDTICAAVESYVPVDRYVLRHAINATFGWAGVVFAGRLAGRLFGPWSGVLTLIFLGCSPRYFADAMNNPKDLPFAAAAIAVLYYMSTVSPRWPYLSRSTMIKLVVALAVALNVRPAALMYLGYLGLLVGGYVLAERVWTWRRLADTAARLAVVAVGMLLVGTLVWPWAGARPLTRPFEALLSFSNFDYPGGMLFAGRAVQATEIPWYYAPWWLLISTPVVIIVGAALSLGCRPRLHRVGRALLWGVVAIPIVLVIARHSALYDGIRHLLFVSPVLAVLAAAGWAAWLSKEHRTWARLGAGVLLAVGIADVLAYDVRAYPNQTVYFNEIVGGPRGAFARYDMDYWGNCVLQAVAWTARTAQLSGVPVSVSGDPWRIIRIDAERFHEIFFTPPQRAQHQLQVRLARGSADLVVGLATGPDALYKVQTPDGAVLCVVERGPTFSELAPHLKLPPPGLSAHQLLTR